MILVTTPGKVGSETARLLAGRGVGVRMLARRPDKAIDLSRAGVDVVAGDLDDATSVDAAMLGVESVVLVSPAVVDQELTVIDRAVSAGVGHVVKVTSTAAPDSPIARQRGQAEIEARLQASGLPYTLLRNNFYMQNFLMLAPAVAHANGFGASSGDGRVGFVDTRDVGAVAAEIVAAPLVHAGRTYRLTGPQLLSYADVAQILSAVLGRSVRFTPRSREEDTKEMIRAGLPEPVAAMNAHAVSLIADGDGAWLSEDVADILGRPPRTFEQFASDHSAAFNAS